jgi:transposase-like protein
MMGPMAWKEVSPVDERKRFINEWLSDEWTATELCESFGISRKTGYKWWERFSEEGLDGPAAGTVPAFSWATQATSPARDGDGASVFLGPGTVPAFSWGTQATSPAPS